MHHHAGCPMLIGSRVRGLRVIQRPRASKSPELRRMPYNTDIDVDIDMNITKYICTCIYICIYV